MAMVLEQRPVEPRACPAGQGRRGRVEEDAIGDPVKFLHPRQCLGVLQPDRFPDFRGREPFHDRKPFGRLAAVELDDIGTHRAERVAGQLLRRSEENTSELPSLMSNSYAGFWL